MTNIQIPSGATGTVVGVFIYSCVALTASLLVVWMAWAHRERTSYVALLAYLTSCGTAFSMTRQVHDFVWWENVMEASFKKVKENPNDPELILGNGVAGLDRVMFWFQFYCYHTETMLLMFWSLALVQSVYNLDKKPGLKRPLALMNRGGKVFSFIFPATIFSIIQIPSVRASRVTYMLLADVPLMLSLALGTAAILSILIRYILSRRRTVSFGVNYHPSNQSGSRERLSGSGPSRGSGTGSRRKKAIYDRWLIARFTIAFVVLTGFELTLAMLQLLVMKNTNADSRGDKVDISLARAKQTFHLYLSGVTPSILLFVLFGTTKPFLKYMSDRIPCISKRPVKVNDDGGESGELKTLERISIYRLSKLRGPVKISEIKVTSSVSSSTEKVAEVNKMKPLPEPPREGKNEKDGKRIGGGAGMGYSWEIRREPTIKSPPRAMKPDHKHRRHGS